MTEAAQQIDDNNTEVSTEVEAKGPVKIGSPIVSYSVQRESDKADAKPQAEEKKGCCGGECSCKGEQTETVALTENMERPEMLVGATYKVKSPLEEHALYVTVNDYVLEDGTRRPFELFLNSKNMQHFQWVVAMTRIVSAVFRKGGDVTFLVDELKQVFDPNGGWHLKGGGWCPSLVAMIGMKLEEHFMMIGLMKAEEMDEHQKAFLAQKREEFEAKQKGAPAPAQAEGDAKSDFPDGAQLCPKCSTKAMIQMDGCMTCLNCGDSKCG